jgi:hypothetical protein
MQFLELKVSPKYLQRGGVAMQHTEKISHGAAVTRQLTMAFYSPGVDDKSWVNKLVVMCSKNPYSHCELIFDNGLATSILHGENIFCKKRTFASENYTFKGFNVSHATHEKIYNYACQESRKNIPFSSSAMLTPVIRWKLRQQPVGTFCSKYIVELLQHGGISWAMDLNADFCTPSSIYDSIQQERNICFNTVPHKLNQLKIIY